MPLHIRMLVGFVFGLTAGMLVHWFAPDAAWAAWLTAWVTQPAGQVFLRLLFMLVIPLVFSALVIGVVEMGDVRALGRIGWKTLVYTVVVCTISLAIGLVLVNLVRPNVTSTPC